MPHATVVFRCPEHQIIRGDVYVAFEGRMLIVNTYFPDEGKVKRLYIDLAVLDKIRRYRIEDAVWPVAHAFILQDKLDLEIEVALSVSRDC